MTKTMGRILPVLSLVLLASCGAGNTKDAAASDARSESQESYKVAEREDYSSNTTRKYITTASLTIRLNDLKNSELLLHEIMDKYDAYLSATSVREESSYYIIRIPADNYTSCFEELKILGKISYYHENREDVTLNYYDTEGRLATQQELMKKYQSYIAKATTIEEIMAVERQIAELQHEIDKTGDEFTRLNNEIDFSTVRLTLEGPRSDDRYYTETIGDRIKSLFNRYDDYIATTITLLVGLIIYGIPSLIILLLLYLILFGKIGILKKIWRLLNESKIKNNK